MPSFGEHQHLYRIRLIGASELTQLGPESFQHLITLASLSISKSRLSYIDEKTFVSGSIKNTLSTVDLSYGNIIEIPIRALSHLDHLQWLSLQVFMLCFE